MLSIIRLGLFAFTLALVLSNSVLGQKSQACFGQTQDHYWQEASTLLAGDQTIDRLSAYRLQVCQQLADGDLDIEQARSLWERALVDAVTVQAAVEKARVYRTVLRVYGTF